MGLIAKIVNGLKKTKQAIAFKLQQLFGRGIFDEEFFEELEYILLSADIGAVTCESIIESMRDAMGQDKEYSTDMATKYIRDIMLNILGDDNIDIQPPAVIMVVGVNGVGKTTTIGKLANLLVKQKYSVVVAGADTFRAAAGEQLEVWCKRAGVRIIKHEEGSDPASVVFDTLSSAVSKNTDIVLIDTAGRLHNKKNLMEELKKINRVIDREHPTAQKINLLVLDATTGQNALSQLEVFDEAVDIDGIVLTKLDGTAKGGVVLAIKDQFDIPVSFVGVGEGIDDLLEFDANSYVEGII